MSGRYGISVTRQELKDYLDKYYNINTLNENIVLPRYNIAPGQNVVSLINDGLKYRVGLLKWGFVPPWSKDEKNGYKMKNARSETLKEKPAFKKSFYQRRCVMISDGYFEWSKTTSTKIPYYIYLKNNKIFCFAGLYTVFKREDGTKLYTCTIITTKANSLLQPIHDRMPVILNEETAKLWLNQNLNDSDSLEKILVQYDPKEMELHQVSQRVNKTDNDDIDIIKKLVEDEKKISTI